MAENRMPDDEMPDDEMPDDEMPDNHAETTRVSIDNSSSSRYTIFDVFTQDRSGVLYDIAKTLFEMNMSIHFAKIGTYIDQVVDVFYVTDNQGAKIEEQSTLEEVRAGLLGVAEKRGQDSFSGNES